MHCLKYSNINNIDGHFWPLFQLILYDYAVVSSNDARIYFVLNILIWSCLSDHSTKILANIYGNYRLMVSFQFIFYYISVEITDDLYRNLQYFTVRQLGLLHDNNFYILLCAKFKLFSTYLDRICVNDCSCILI